MEDKSFRQNIKVIISEFIMVVAVIITVSALAFVVSGYWVNSDFKIERNGMIQVSSTPSGADLDIDGESSWLRRTNTSKILSSGEHHVTISKEGYDTWSKTIDISEGLLYRLNYPRLFLKDRKVETAYDISKYTYASSPHDHSRLLLIGDTTKWSVLNLRQEDVSSKIIDVTNVLGSAQVSDNSSAGLFTGEVLSSVWNRGGDRVLLQLSNNSQNEWIILDVIGNNTINLSRTFNKSFADVRLVNRNECLAVIEGNLVKLDLGDKVVSEPIVTNLHNYQLYDNRIIYSVSKTPSQYDIGIVNYDGTHDETIMTLSEPPLVSGFKFYEEVYLAVVTGSKISLYNAEDYTEPVITSNLGFAPSAIMSGQDGEFVLASSGGSIATIDMEANAVKSWQVLGNGFGWVDDYMPYSVHDGELTVYDFDGLNQRTLAKNVSSRFPVFITDNKWLYYFSDGDLMREWLIKE